MISVVIPSRQEQFLSKTIEDILKNSRGEIEVIAVLDGGPQELPSDPRVKSIVHGSSRGMRASINEGVAIAKGEYIMKLDGHCMVDEGFDVKLVKDIEKNWVVIPRRKRLDADLWQIQDVGKPDVDYEYLSFPDDPRDFGGPGLNGKIWTQRILERENVEIDDTPASQGSCWFMHKDYFHELGLMDEKSYGTFWNESQEIALGSILSGGRYVVNKKTWYAHLHKGKKHGRGYSLDHSQLNIGRNNVMRYFAGEKVKENQKYPLSYLIEKFPGMPGWTDERIKELKERESQHWPTD